MPEPDEAKVSSPVLRGVGSREAPLLPGPQNHKFTEPRRRDEERHSRKGGHPAAGQGELHHRPPYTGGITDTAPLRKICDVADNTGAVDKLTSAQRIALIGIRKKARKKAGS